MPRRSLDRTELMLESLQRYINTIRYLRLCQVLGRVLPETRRRLARWGIPTTWLPSPPGELGGRVRAKRPFLSHDPWNKAQDLLDGRFVFLNRPRELGRPVDWSPQDASLLWRYNLHYFDYLHLLDPGERERICLEWVEANPPTRTVGWDPYPTSRRLVNWCKAGLRDQRLLQSLYRQAAFLHRNVEEHILGNHVLANAKALLFAGACFQGRGESAAWTEQGTDILRKELPEQILSDGGHFERSPMYHAIVLHDVLDLINLLPTPQRVDEVLPEVASRMLPFLRAVTHPDGGLALFNDTTREIAPPTRHLLEYAGDILGTGMESAQERGGRAGDGATTDGESDSAGHFSASGYYIHRRSGTYLIVDGGKIGPDYLPAHAHADLFSFELSLAGVRIVVDRGCHGYTAGPLRDQDRATRSHNTVTVDGTSQAECWRSFRVARRFPPRGVRFERSTSGAVFEGVFDGYARLIGDGIVHRRRLRLTENPGELRVEDIVEGEGRHCVESRLRLHPTVKVEKRSGALCLTRGGVSCSVRSLAGGLPVLSSDAYSPEFGVRIPTLMLDFRSVGELPLCVGYRLEFALEEQEKLTQ